MCEFRRPARSSLWLGIPPLQPKNQGATVFPVGVREPQNTARRSLSHMMLPKMSPTMEGPVMLTWRRLRELWGDPSLRNLSEPTAAGARSMQHRMTVLLVARNYSLRESLAVLGVVKGWDVCWASSCDETTDILKLRSIPLVICDEEVPEGWRTIIERIVFLPQSTCVLLASRFCDEALRREARRCHAYDVIAKPFNWEEVTDRVFFAWAWYTSCCGSWWGPNADDRVLRHRQALTIR
jgi:hypothetical protein